MSKFRIFLLDDHKIIRDGLRRILNASEEFTVIGEEGDPAKFIDLIDRISADMIILDISFPGGSGFQILPLLRKRRPDIKIVVLSMHNDPEFMQKSLLLGAEAHLTKDIDAEEFLRALSAVKRGVFVQSPSKANSVLESSTGALTQREIEVLTLLANGYSSKQIGAELAISGRTVETHRLKIMKKLGTSNSAETISVAAKLRLI